MAHIMVMPERYSAAGLVKAYRLMVSKLDDPEFFWVNKQSEWMGHRHEPQEWLEWFYLCLTDKINRTLPRCGKGSKAERRRKQLSDETASCRWCGTKTGRSSKVFCDPTCASSYRGYP